MVDSLAKRRNNVDDRFPARSWALAAKRFCQLNAAEASADARMDQGGLIRDRGTENHPATSSKAQAGEIFEVTGTAK